MIFTVCMKICFQAIFMHTKKLEGRYLFTKKKDYCIRMITPFFIFCLCGNLLSETEIISCSKIRFN